MIPICRYRLCLLVLFLSAGVAGFFSVPALAEVLQRDDIITLALDAQEAGGDAGPEDHGVASEPGGGKEVDAGRPDGRPAKDLVDHLTACVRHSFNVGYEFYNYNYQEMSNGKKFMNNRGEYSGLDMEYAYRPDMQESPFYEFVDALLLQGRVAAGKVDYTGSGTFSGIDDHMFELRALMAKSYSFADAVNAAPYVGVGYRYLNNGLEKFSPGGYNRESRYLYLPAGVDLSKKVGGGWDLSMNLEYDWLLSGEQKSHLEDVNSLLDTLVNEQKSGYGLRGSLKVSKDFHKRVNIFVEPFIRYWSINASDVRPITVGGVQVCDSDGCWAGQEPENVTREVGLRMGVGF